MTTISIWADDGTGGRVAHKDLENINEDITPFVEECKRMGLNHFRIVRDNG